MTAAATSDPAIAEGLRRALRQVAYPVSVITTLDENQGEGPQRFTGLTASSVTSVSLDPPSMLVCVNQSARSHGALMDHGTFAINLLTHEQAEVAKVMAFGEDMKDRFGAGPWLAGPQGLPILSGALASLICQREAALAYGTHTILVGQVIQVIDQPGMKLPLLYRDGGFCQPTA